MRYSAIDPGFFSGNRENLKKKIQPGSVAILASNFQMPRNGDQFHTYRQQSDFFYLTGIEQEKSLLVLTPDAPSKDLQEVLFILKANKTLEIWEGHKLTPEEAQEISGIKTIKYIEEFDSILHSLIVDMKNLYFNIPELAKFSPEVLTADALKAAQIKEKYPLHNYERLAPILQELRLIKSDTEIELLRKAIEISGVAFQQVLKGLKPEMMEYEIEALLGYEFIRKGAGGHAYAPIVAGGKNACVLHYIENDCRCKDGELLLMDFGAEYANYAADLSRTIPINGTFSKRQRELYQANLDVFYFARSLMKPGTTINKLHSQVCNFWEEKHLQLGLYTAKEAKEHKDDNPLWFNYYMHGTSHFLGLDVHDVGTREIELKPGMVLTCEPAIYIAEEQVGIRIENDVLITETGNIDLANGVIIEADDIEEHMNTAG